MVGRVSVSLESHLEAIDGAGFIGTPQAQPRVTIGQIANEDASRVIRSRAGVFRACYQRELNRNPAAAVGSAW